MDVSGRIMRSTKKYTHKLSQQIIVSYESTRTEHKIMLNLHPHTIISVMERRELPCINVSNVADGVETS